MTIGSLPRNVTATYASQIYVTAVGIVIMPLYLRLMGAEAFGLVGFFTLLQAWFGLLDLGLSATIQRESARYRSGASDLVAYRRLVRALELIFLTIAIIGGTAFFFASSAIARHWLVVRALPIGEVQFAIEMMGLSVVLRWMAGLYRGMISGTERLVWLGGFTSLITTFRFIGVLPVLILFGPEPRVFFQYQLLVAVLEFAGFWIKATSLLPAVRAGRRIGWSLSPIRSVLSFSLSVAFASCVGLMATQTDKLILSRVLPLADYGYFSLAVLVASGVLMIGAPVATAIMPRMAKLEANGDRDGITRIYRQSTQLVAVAGGTATGILVFYGEPLLRIWTGNAGLAFHASPILSLYAIGNCLFSLCAFPYYLQYARGNLRLHLIGSVTFAVLLTPAVIWGATSYGARGAGLVWLGANLATLALWVPFVHARIQPGLNRVWFQEDVGLILVTIVLTSGGLRYLVPVERGSALLLTEIILFGLVVGAMASLSSPFVRGAVIRRFHRDSQVRL